ncbi:MAG: hypothetical protein U0P45_13815 [Acidimicrobiales bacterium]
MGLILLFALAGVAAVAAGNALLVRSRGAVSVPTVPDGSGAAWMPPSAEVGVARRRRARRRRALAAVLRRPGAATWLFLACAALYAGVGAYLTIHAGSIVGDAESRVADSFYVFFSRDPHLAAVGFVWNPLPSFAAAPFFLLKGVFPAVTERAYAGSLMSALFMAGAVVQVRGAVKESGVDKVLGWVLVAAFALNPMVVYYGANGMSEAPYVFFLAACVRYLARWIATGRLTPLVWSGIALGACYLARYEAAVAAVGASVVVVVVSWMRTSGPGARRAKVAASDLAVFVLPFAAAFIGWAITSFVITGSAFEYLSSQYGNTSQVKTVGVDNLPGHGTGLPLPVFVTLQMLSFSPLLPLLAVAAAFHARRWRDLRILAPLLALGAISVFIFLTFVSGTTFGWLRLHLPVAVMSTLCIAYLFAPVREPVGAPGDGLERSKLRRPVGAGSAIALAALLAVVAVPTSAWAMSDRRLGVGEVPQLRWVLHPERATQGDRDTKAIPTSAATIAAEIDEMQLPPGSVVMDTFTPCVSLMLMTSVHPHQFVITSDRDFQRTLAEPATFGARYLLVPPPGGYGDLDAVARAYPSLYAKGAPGARLVRTFDERGCPKLRMYEVLEAKGTGG